MWDIDMSTLVSLMSNTFQSPISDKDEYGPLLIDRFINR